MSQLFLGISQMEVSPQAPLPLAGFGHRKGDFAGVSRPLYVRAWLFARQDEQGQWIKTMLIQADIIWWSSECIERLGRKLGKQWKIDAANMLFLASHTHGGPQTTGSFCPVLGIMLPSYIDFLEWKVGEAVAAAHGNMEPVTAERGSGVCAGISVNRRLWVDGAIVMAPNPDGVKDDEVTVIRFHTPKRKTKGVLFHYACHPTTTSTNWVTSEYCGAAMEKLDRQLGAGVSCFMQGCCGDIRPAVYGDGGFYSGDERHIEQHGNQLAEVVLEVMRQPMEALGAAELKVWHARVELPYAHVPTSADLQADPADDETTRQWKQLLLAHPDKLRSGAMLSMQLLQIADGLAILAMDGEVVVEYGLLIKQLSMRHVLPLGYCNGMVGYIPTARQIREGGYESRDSTVLFGYPSPFKEEIEPIIREGIHGLLNCL